jgi:excisionase family DNA binding protein
MSKRDDVIEPLLTIKDVAKILKTSEKTVRRRIRSKALEAVQDGRVLRVTPRGLRTYIALNRRS